ncbi:MAG: PIN domain-containing protein [Bryobacterales bacterium]|nr:PIN domain-containing protein [Bryobacterales bacterium]
MIALDTNLLVYSHRPDMEWHVKAAALVRNCAESSALWAIPWPCIHEFYAIVTNARIFRQPSPPEMALHQIGVWMKSPNIVLLAERPGYWELAHRIIEAASIRGAQVHDARIAALCLFHGVAELWTADRDFQRFPNLKTRNPLVQPPA